MTCNPGAGGSSIKLDMYGNLYFVESHSKAVMKIVNSDLEKVFNLPPRANMTVLHINLTC